MTFTSRVIVMDNALMAASNQADMLATTFLYLGKYIYMTIIPYPLSYDYSFNQIPVVSWSYIKPVLALLVCIIMFVYLLSGLKKKLLYSFLIAFFFITLSISSNLFVKIEATFGERFLYTPSVSFCIAIPVLLSGIFKLNPLAVRPDKFLKPVRSFFYGTITVLLVVFGFIVITRNKVWKNNLTLYQSGIETSPNSSRAHLLLGDTYSDMAKMYQNAAIRARYYSQALYEMKKATGICPDDWHAYYNLGACYDEGGYPDSAISPYTKVLELNPKVLHASYNLGITYKRKAQYEKAISYFKMSYETDTGNIGAFVNMVLCYQALRDYNEAFHYDSLILKIFPDKKNTILHLAIMHNELGVQYAGNNEFPQALREFHSALLCDSNSVNALGNTGVVYQKTGNKEMAKEYFQKALSKDPNNKLFLKHLKELY
jgi:Flp pilus assembly protein TadD